MAPVNVEHECVIDVMFTGPQRPSFGDVFRLCGDDHPNFPSADPRWGSLDHLRFEQVDDYFAILDEGTDEPVIWLYPLAQGSVVHHHPGPFDGLRLHYGPELDSSSGLLAHFVDVVECLANLLPAQALWGRRREPLGPPIATDALAARVRRFVDTGE
ncbi:hypothetical protein [Streptomyces palmae]|uniref:Uncharacterized protein n=1 Tax=Streptomyces palmae TaxID=1701085 RepID=A0A4Z0HC26_9ACTN|nr:hypothetical protein [Streptomyces palmae]TGB17080.1 hypothetical protein E4099_04045 [Streptomyces palmae]